MKASFLKKLSSTDSFLARVFLLALFVACRFSLAGFSLPAVFVVTRSFFAAFCPLLFARCFLPVAFFAGLFVGGPKWTRTTDLTIISRAL